MRVIATHAVFLEDTDIYGPPHAVSLYFNKKKIDHIFIKHRLFAGERSSIVEYYVRGRLKKTSTIPLSSNIYPLRLIEEMRLTWSIVGEYQDIEVFIGVNPLNNIAGQFLKNRELIDRLVYLSADYAIRRFDNPIMNWIYQKLDTRAMAGSDQTWSVSRRIVANRRDRGLDARRNLLLPNAPFFADIKRRDISRIRPHDLVLVSALESGIAFERVIDAVLLLSKKIRDIRLILIGGGSKEQELRTLVRTHGLEKHVIFKGAMSHDDMFKILVTSGVGIALYDVADPNHFRYFSDPMKVRDYMASGLPVIVSGNSAIGSEIKAQNAGYVLSKLNTDELEKLLGKLLHNKRTYGQMRKNAIELARTYDTYTLIEKYLAKL